MHPLDRVKNEKFFAYNLFEILKDWSFLRLNGNSTSQSPFSTIVFFIINLLNSFIVNQNSLGVIHIISVEGPTDDKEH